MLRFFQRMTLPALVRRIRAEGLTYLSVSKFTSLIGHVKRLNRAGVPGDFVEFGVALGGSAIYLARAAEGRRFIGFDVFGLIPSPGSDDDAQSHARYDQIKSGAAKGIAGKPYYGYQNDLYHRVQASFATFNVPVDQISIVLKKGLFEDTVHFSDGQYISLAHVDCDWYESVMFCLDQVAPRLSPGGVIIVDDYNDYGGARKAVECACERYPYLLLTVTKPHAVLIRSDAGSEAGQHKAWSKSKFLRGRRRVAFKRYKSRGGGPN